ncbi:MAG: tetratricopeptide repeat protein [Pseudomonadota bacterium]
MTPFFRQLANEIRRRKVLRVLAFYAVSAWLVLQIGEVTFEPLGLPDWSMRTLIFTVIMGFPVSLVLAWVIDIRSDGLIFDLPLWVGDTDAPRTARKSDLIYLLVPAMLLIGGTYKGIELFTERVGGGDPFPISADGPSRASIGVLAFESFDDSSDSQFFANGLAEEILFLLNGVPSLDVAARSSSFQLSNAGLSATEVAERLNVGFLLEGSARRSGDQIRVTAQLVDGEKGLYQWSQVFDRQLSDVFTIQQEIAHAVVRELKVAMSLDDEARLDQTPTKDIDAYLLFLQGREQLRSSIDADIMRRAIASFEQALLKDASFARAHAGICEARLRIYEITNAISDFEQAEDACNNAASVDPEQLTDTRMAMAQLNRARGRLTIAADLIEQVIVNAPDDAAAYIALGEIRSDQKREAEARSAFANAIELKPSDWRAHEALASFLYRNEFYEEAAGVYEEVTRLAPEVASGHAGKGAAYWMLDELETAEAAYRRSLALKPSRQGYTNMGLRFYYAGRFDDAADMQREALKYAPDDHRVWGRLAESLRLAGAAGSESAEAYVRARDLASGNLQINPSDWSTRGLLALYSAHLGQDDALAEAARAVADSEENAEALYYEALCLLEFGSEAEAVDRLHRAVEGNAGYRRFIRDDPDLAVLAERADFQALVSEP